MNGKEFRRSIHWHIRKRRRENSYDRNKSKYAGIFRACIEIKNRTTGCPYSYNKQNPQFSSGISFFNKENSSGIAITDLTSVIKSINNILFIAF